MQLDIKELTYGLTERQTQGALHSGCATIITAGAGAGKTAVMTRRIKKYVIESHGLKNEPHYQIQPDTVALTFTKASANEMKVRITKLLGDHFAKYVISATFHSFAINHILKPNWKNSLLKDLGCSGSNIKYPSSRQEAFLKREASFKLSREQQQVIKGFTKETGRDFSSWLTLVRSFCHTPLSYWNQIKNKTKLTSFEDLLATDKLINCPDEENFYFLKAWYLYEEGLFTRGLIDMDQVLNFATLLLEQDKEVRVLAKRKFRSFFVDEFQDTNFSQYRFVMALSGKGNNLSLFGDIKQAIYGFRGGNCHLFANITKQFEEFKMINLPDNFRSTHAIVDAANELQKSMSMLLSDESMISHADTIEPVTCFNVDNQLAEAEHVTTKISELIKAGTKPYDIGVLYRYHKLTTEIENLLITQGIPYRKLGGEKSLYEEEDIKNIVGFLHLIFKPHDPDSLFYFFGKTHTELKVSKTMIKEAMKAVNPNNQSKHNNHIILSYIMNNMLNNNPRAFDKLEVIAKAILTLSSNIYNINSFERFAMHSNFQYEGLEPEDKEGVFLSNKQKFTKVVGDYIKELLEVYCEIFLKTNSNGKQHSESRIESDKEHAKEGFNDIFSIKKNIVPSFNLTEYISSRPLILNEHKKVEVNMTDVELMTVHSSKGLEREAIFVIGCNEHLWFKGDGEHVTTEQLHEEMRLFYVAITRAIKRLYISAPKTYEHNNKIKVADTLYFLKLIDEKMQSINLFSKEISRLLGLDEN